MENLINMKLDERLERLGELLDRGLIEKDKYDELIDRPLFRCEGETGINDPIYDFYGEEIEL